MDDELFSDMLNLASRLVVEAGSFTAARLGHGVVERKPDDSVVTQTDRAIQASLLEAIRAAYPDHAIVAEEPEPTSTSHPDRTAARLLWVMDPLDGTRNYASGLPCFATSLAVLDRGEPVVGVVYEHNLRQLYTAVRGRGAQLDGRPIRAGGSPPEHDQLVAIPSGKNALTVSVLREWAAAKGIVLRNLGATTMHLALVASGALAAALGTQSKIWDVAAGALLVTEAGGIITDLTGAPLTPLDVSADPHRDVPFLAGAPRMHARLLASIGPS